MTWKCDRCGSENNDQDPECSECEQEKKPYYRKSLDQGKARDQFTVELDREGREWIEIIKARLDFKSDSKVLKICLENAIKGNSLSLSEKTWRYLLSPKRQRLSNFQKLPDPSPDGNAMQK